MSIKFRNRVHDRLRKGLCVACGQPKAFCKCKSNYFLPEGTSCIQTHNNKKRRRAMAAIEAREQVYKLWYKNQYLFENTIGEKPPTKSDTPCTGTRSRRIPGTK